MTAPGWYPSEGQLRWWDGERWTDHVAPLAGAQQLPPRQPVAQAVTHPAAAVVQPQRKGGVPMWVKVSGGVVGTLVVVGAIGSALDGSSSSSLVTAGQSSTSAAATPATSGKAAVSKAAAIAPTPTKATSEQPAPKATYKKLTSRAWLLVAKNPGAHLGETYVIYGAVTQLDSITGTETFRANIDAAPHDYTFKYPTNTVMSGYEQDLADLVEGDFFRAEVSVLGTVSYDTTLGGKMTVPQLMVTSIKVTGHEK